LTSVSVEALYSFVVHGGAITPDINLGVFLPDGAIVTDVLTDVIEPVTSLGTPELLLKLGSEPVVAVLDATLLTGVNKEDVAPAKATDKTELKLDINTAAVTAGKVRFIVQYLLP